MRRAALVATAAALALSACPARTPPPGGEVPVRGGTLRALLAADVDSLDPHRAARPGSWWFARALHRGLLAFPSRALPDGARPVPDLAEALPAVEGLAYTFRLRQGARFGAPLGRAITAADVRASVERILRVNAGVARYLRVIEGASRFARGEARRVSGISTPDERTVVIRLARPATDLAWILAHPQVAVLPEGTPLRADPRSIPGAGPYRLASYRPEREILLARNPSWERALDPVRAAHVDAVRARLGEPPPRAARAVEEGTADLVVDEGPPDARPAGAYGERGSRSANGCLRFLFLDADAPPFGVVSVRRAVAHAIVRAPAGVPPAPAVRILPPTVLGSRDEPVLAEDVRHARRLLAAAGLGRGFSTTLVVADTERDRREADEVRRALARARIRVLVRAVHPALLYPDHYRRGGTPVGLATWCADWPGLAGRSALTAIADPRLSGSPGPVFRKPRSRALERALDAATAAPEDRADTAWARADRLAVLGASIVPIRWLSEWVGASGRLRGLEQTPMFARGDPTAMWLEPR